MWLVQLYKARDNTTQGVYSTDNCQIEHIRNYIDPQEYESELRLCNNWEYENKKKILIFNKQQNAIILSRLQNERLMSYEYAVSYNFIYTASNIFSLEYRENNDFLIDFYVFTKIHVQFDIPDEISSAPNIVISFLRYIKGKTLKIGVIDSETPKYSFVFDDYCKYYYYDNILNDHKTIYVVKNPFWVSILLLPNVNFFVMVIGMKPRLIEEFNNYGNNSSNYNPANDQPLRVDDIINLYFDSITKEGLSYNNVDINDDTDNFRYNLIRALLGTFEDNIYQNYYFSLDNDIGDSYQPENSYMPLAETPVCIYFPLFRPQLDNNRLNKIWPQYSPNDTSKYVYGFHLNIRLRNSGEVLASALSMRYGNSLDNVILCSNSLENQMSSWRFGSCDLTLPFRFVGVADCTATDDWNNDTIRHNANYLFRIVKPSSTNSYNMKGIGCDELTTEISSFSEFSADYEFSNSIFANGMDEIQRITFSESGYPVEGISNAIVDFRIANNQTCFVLFNERLVVNQDDFRSIYQAVTAPLPNAIVCYMGSSETVPSTHKNKVIHSDAVVTVLDTNEQIPLVIKYIRYAKRLHKLFNG